MKIVLLKDIKNLGMQGDVCEVGDGYALNFLIPRREAVSVGDTAAESILRKRADRERKRTADAAAAKEVFSQVPSSVSMRMPVNDSGKLFQAVTPAVLCEHLAKAKGDSPTVSAEWFSFSPIKEVGEHTAVAAFGGEEKTITLTIEREP